jgi:hypothetical protein
MTLFSHLFLFCFLEILFHLHLSLYFDQTISLAFVVSLLLLAGVEQPLRVDQIPVDKETSLRRILPKLNRQALQIFQFSEYCPNLVLVELSGPHLEIFPHLEIDQKETF